MNPPKKIEFLKEPKPVEPIAIVGMSCRFPKANTLAAFWELLSQGVDAIAPIPADRWNVEDYYDPDPTATKKTNQRHGGMLENIHDFDPLFFNISPAEAVEMTPSQKLMLELTWEAIENSTMPFTQVQGKKAGVYIGNIWNDFEHLRKHKNAVVTSHSAVGQSSNIIANRVSFSFGFSGPSLVVDTGCSSSLVALHLACQSLWDGSTEMAVTGGINHIMDPDQYILLTKFGGLSTKGKCSTFDIEADGFVRGEGAGVLLLKTLSQAEKDGDKIYALIRGTAMNNNGFNVNLPATSVAGQKQVLQDAYKHSGIDPNEIHYVEAHGTGTKLGDPTESRALGEFFGAKRSDAKLRVGSVKTNIGHLEAAAGIAGLIKVVLAMSNKMLPPSLNFKTPNPNIPFEELKLEVQSALTPWPVKNGETLKAGINSFGWGGTNAHTVIEEYRAIKEKTVSQDDTNTRYCLPVSAKSPAALEAYIKSYVELLKDASWETCKNVCVASSILKPAFDHRVMFTGNNTGEILKALEDFVPDASQVAPQKLQSKTNKVVFIFPGQGSQWLGMGQELLRREPVFKKAIEDCDNAFAEFTNWSLLEQLHATPEQSRLNEINVIQPMLCAMQIALAKLWMSWGITPDAVVGHSMGEVAAAHISGALTLEDAARIICTRSILMRTVSGKGGAMAVTELSLSEAEEFVKRYPKLSVAVSNSPKSTVLAGDQGSIDEVLSALEQQNLFCRQVKVDVASHSQQMDPLKENLRDALQTITPRPVTYPIHSTVKMKAMKGDDMNADYWVDNLRGTVQFASVMQELMQSGHTVFIEVSPHPVLMNAVNECAQHFTTTVLTIPSLLREKPEHETLFKNFGDLFAGGFNIPWNIFYNTRNAPDVKLPSYPFQREKYEIEDKSAELDLSSKNNKYPLLGKSIVLADEENVYFWETQVSTDLFPYMKDHQVNETPVLPGVTYLEMVLEASSDIYTHGVPVVTDLKFIKSVTLSKDPSTLQLKITQDNQGKASFRFFQKSINESGKTLWAVVAEGKLHSKPRHHLKDNIPASAKQAHGDALPAEKYYDSLKALGLQYGPAFQGLKELTKTKHPLNEVHFTIQLDEKLKPAFSKYKIHPAVLDSFLQPLFYDVAEEMDKDSSCTTFLSEIGEVSYADNSDLGSILHGVATLYPIKKEEHKGLIHVEADITIFNERRAVVLKVKGVKGKVIDSALIEKQREKLSKWLYKINWVKQSAEPAMEATTTKGAWVVLGDPFGISDIVVEKLNAAGTPAIHVSPAAGYEQLDNHNYTINYGIEGDYDKLMDRIFRKETKIEGIIHAASMSYNWVDPPLTADAVEEQQIFGSISFMYLHQRLAALKLFELPKLVIVTNGIQTVGVETDIAQPVHSPLWGMAKVMFNELTQYHCRYFDLSANPSMEELDLLVKNIRNPLAFENEVVFRGQDTYMPRLNVHQEEDGYQEQEKNRQFSTEGTYLVTGFKGLGFHFIEWMIKQGARSFALVSRTGEAPVDVLEKINVYENNGCTFRIFCADTGVYSELKAVIDYIDSDMPPLKGVVHAAGVIEARTLTELNQEGFLRILNPKVKGAWNLHLLTQHKPLDCFIMFSSASTLIGLSGQGSYVAANAFLDTLAQSRKRMGLAGMSINWGVIKDVGMVANEADLEKYARAEGFEPVSMKDALEVFNTIYDSEHTQIGIVKLHADSMGNYYSSLAKTRYFKGLLTKENNGEALEKSFLSVYKKLQNKEEKTLAIEHLVSQHVSKIVKTPVSRIKPTMTFKGMGIDSLMAIQLRNLLEKSLNLKLSVAIFWTYPSIKEYAAYLENTLSETATEEISESQSKKPSWFVRPQPDSKALLRLFCFHDAGGSASLFDSWSDLLKDVVEVVSVELPGRGHRMNEKMYTDLKPLLDDMLPHLEQLTDKPFLFFGHSMGGVLAFEMARELARLNKKLPLKLFISSTPGLTTYHKREVDHTLTDGELMTMFPHLQSGNIPDIELQQMLLKMLRSDLHLLNNYAYKAESPLNIPLTAIHGNEDLRVSRKQMEKWEDETSSSFNLISRPGGHRYIENDAEYISELLKKDINTVLKPNYTI